MNTKVNYQEKIIALWTVFLLGTIFHTQLALMPLFHGLDVSHGHGETAASINEISYILWLMLAFFVLPMIAIVGTAFYNSYRYRSIHFGLTVVYSVMNLLHVVLDLFVDPIAWYQIVLMVVLLLVGIILNVVSYQWMQQGHHRIKLSQSS
ncbi:hypothetical protein STA3757_41200 [Stanieria sp. NIES-3757]|nr:hypothetical protein STA3757_41200 [Stanieria sp. NIES-3757]